VATLATIQEISVFSKVEPQPRWALPLFSGKKAARPLISKEYLFG
jgi:hypothetical protein